MRDARRYYLKCLLFAPLLCAVYVTAARWMWIHEHPFPSVIPLVVLVLVVLELLWLGYSISKICERALRANYEAKWGSAAV